MTGKQILLGKILGPHGLKGEVKIKSFTADPLAVASYGPLSVPDGRRFTLERARLHGDIVVAGIKGVADRTFVEALKGLELKIARDDLPEASSDEFYQADLIGLPVVDSTGREIGEVLGFQNFGAGELIEIKRDRSRSSFLPFTNDMVPVVDTGEGKIVLSETGIAVLAADDGEKSERPAP
jgi:16S rRNA processing protein RimM